MKKKYMEPQMVVEDFTVSEMIAADCVIPTGELKVVTQMSHDAGGGCDSGREPKYWVDGIVDGKHNGLGTVYAFLSDLYDWDKDGNDRIDINQDGQFNQNDACFTTQYQGPGVCRYDPIKEGDTFGYGYVCNDSTSALQKS